MRDTLFTMSLTSGVVGALLIGICQDATARHLNGQEVKMCTWGGTARKVQTEFIAKPLEEHGAKVLYVTGSPQDNMAKLIAARGQPVCDVIEILDAMWDPMMELGFLRKPDFSKIPNAKFLPDRLVSEWRTGSWFTQEGICYDSKKFAEHNIPTPTTYKDLIHPELAGRIQIPDITSGGGLANVGGLTYAAGGEEQNIVPGLTLIQDLKVRKFWKRGAETITLLESGDIWAAVVHVGWCLRGRKAGLKDLKFVHPKIDAEHTGVSKHGYLGIVKTSDPKNNDAVHAYINGFLDANTQYQTSIRNGTIPANEAAYSRLGEDPVLREMAVLDPAKIKKMLKINYSKVDIASWNDQWNRMVTQ